MTAMPAPDQPHRKARLAKLLTHQDFGGVQAELARFLGLKSGAYIRQLLEGERPITEKLVDKIESAHGGKYKGWFSELPPRQYSPGALRVAAIYDSVSPKDRRYIDAAADAAASPDDPPDHATNLGEPPLPAPIPARPQAR